MLYAFGNLWISDNGRNKGGYRRFYVWTAYGNKKNYQPWQCAILRSFSRRRDARGYMRRLARQYNKLARWEGPK